MSGRALPEAVAVSPQRLRLSRSLKYDLQHISRTLNGLAAVRVDRDSGWENPFLQATPTAAVEMFRRWLKGEMSEEELVSGRGRLLNGAWLTKRRRLLLDALPGIRGKNLACWCKPRDPCHGDVLLEMANGRVNPGALLKSESGL
jgi:hypothetical protein